MKFKFAIMFAVSVSQCFATMTSEEVADVLDLTFRRDMSFDGAARPRRLAEPGIPFLISSATSNILCK